VVEKLKRFEEEQLRQSLVEGYQIRQEEDNEMNREWEATMLDE
jgi:hypothetical protein